MTTSERLLPEGWPFRIAAAGAAAVAGNLLAAWFPWPEGMRESFESAMAAAERPEYFLILTLAAAPLAEELVFRRGIYGWLRRRSGFGTAALVSSLAFGLYHGNWIQGIYGFLMGLVLAWGYEDSAWGKYRMAVLMHLAANLTALAVFG